MHLIERKINVNIYTFARKKHTHCLLLLLLPFNVQCYVVAIQTIVFFFKSISFSSTLEYLKAINGTFTITDIQILPIPSKNVTFDTQNTLLDSNANTALHRILTIRRDKHLICCFCFDGTKRNNFEAQSICTYRERKY